MKTSKEFLRQEKDGLDGFDSKIFSIKSKGSGLLNIDHSKLKTLTPKQILQR